VNARDRTRPAVPRAAGRLALVLMALAGCVSAETVRCEPSSKEQPTRPNVLWISCEDISPDLGCYGDKYADTPNLDRLAREGCRYTNAFVPYPVCAPTRSGIITGMYPSTLGTMHMRTSMKGYEAVVPPEVKCFPEYLRAAGYYCSNHRKTDYQFRSPFTTWDSHGGDWRNSDRPAGAPFFCVINIATTHESRCWPRKNEQLTHDPDQAPVPPYYPDTPVVRRNIARYYDNITRMDTQVGEILQRLAEDNLAGNTVVFFWSDHGRGLPRCKRWPYDSGLHVPLIIRWPGRIEPGSVCDDLVNLIDLGPTVLSLAGVEIPPHVQGRALLGDQKGRPREFVFGGRERMDATSVEHIRTIRDKQYRYIRNFMPQRPYAQVIPYMERMPIMQEWRRLHAEGKLTGPQKLFFQAVKPREELYDVVADPHQIRNLADSPEHQQVLQRMRAALRKKIKETGDLGGLPEDRLIRRMWPDGKQPTTATPTIHTRAANGKIEVRICCETEGASIGYRLGEDKKWWIYTGPINVAQGTSLTAKAIRIGYRESGEVRQVVAP